MATITPPEGFAYASYLAGCEPQDLSAVSFFDFYSFSFRNRHKAQIEWFKVLDVVERQFPKRARKLFQEWKETKHERTEY